MQKHTLDCALMTKTQQQLQKTLHIQRMGTAKPAITTGPLCIPWPKHLLTKTLHGDKIIDRKSWLLNQRMPTARHKDRQMRRKTQIWKMCWTAEKKYLWHCKQVPLGGCAFSRMCKSIHATQEGALGRWHQQEDRLKREGRHRRGFSSAPQCWVQHCSMKAFIINLGDGRVYPQSADDTKMAGGADAPEGQVAILTDLDRIEKRADRNFTKFTKVLHLGKENTMHQHSVDQLESVIFTRRVTKHWNELPREVIETFKTHLSMVLGSLF